MSYAVSLTSLNKSYSIPTNGETNWLNSTSLYLRDLATAVNSATSGGGTVVTPVFNVKTYGATGNGVTDDTVAVNLALAAANVSGGAVYFPAGTYIITSTLAATTQNVRFTGDGVTSIVKQSGSFSTTALIKFLNAPNWSIQNLRLDGAANTGTGPLVLADGSNYGLFVGAELSNAKSYGADFTGGTTPSIHIASVNTQLVSNATGNYRGPVSRLVRESTSVVNVLDQGAIGDGTIVDSNAFDAALAILRALPMGGTLYIPKGCYRLQRQLLVSGFRFVDESQVNITTPTASALPSYNNTLYVNSANSPTIHVIADPGTVLWADFAPSTNTALIYAVAQGLQDPTQIHNVTVTTRDTMSAGGVSFTPSNPYAPVASKVDGIFGGSNRMDIRNCTFLGTSRGIVLCSNYWSVIDHVICTYVVRGLVLPGYNAAGAYNVLVNYASTNAIEASGQSFNLVNTSTEECATALYIPQADSVHIAGTYYEAVGATLTDYQVKIGDGVQAVVECHISTSHVTSTFGKIGVMAGGGLNLVSFGEGTHWYTAAGTHGLLLTDVNCTAWILSNVATLDIASGSLGTVWYMNERLSVAGARLLGPRDTTHSGASGLIIGRAGLATDPATVLLGIYGDNNDTPVIQFEAFSGRIIYGGGLQGHVQAVSSAASYNITTQDRYITVNAPSVPTVMNLPQASTCSGLEILVKKVDSSANAVTMTPHSGDTIEGSASVALTTQYSFSKLVAVGALNTWIKI